ncbi:hypothetical protein CONPUDRAFT_91647 [Coniophora puteana RWD-64-598 SS2]|uniref:Uncharacterized protein n=1 Tax=Coniophora puteana (strain RWD-64-598) TaxID=741705 RepID=A0A5M3MJK9_CONPW|nr:uncharacterized protein CONPUDRAFT_91647 [Coniophora puteana RWD-64-598 SS2]EIW79402.1 hypothetical protein CONPUDRAFT_91647 [Coniophora puteana RWD-64-598 SS2]
MARDRLVTSPPDDSQRIFDLWYLRLSSLARMRLFNHAAAECSSLLGALPPASVLPPNALPFELRVLAARILGRGLEDAPSASASPAPGDPQSVPGGLKDNAAGTSEGGGGPWGQVDALCALLKMCQRRAAPPRLRKANASASEAEDVEALQVAERERDMWRERGARVCMILASVLVDMKEYTTATRMLASLLPGQPPSNSSQSSTSPTATAALHSAIARVHLASGNVVAAEKHFALAYPSSSVEAEPEIAATGAQNEEPKEESPEGKDDGDNTALKVEHPRSASASPNPFVNPDLAPSRPESARPTPPPKSPQPSVASAGDEAAPDHPTPDVNAAIYASAMGDWVKAEGLWRRMPKTDVLATNNLAVALLAQGRITEAIQTLESALRSAPSSAVVAEPFLFNLATLYELHAHTALDKKRALLVETAKWAGDGLKAGCLKLSNA